MRHAATSVVVLGLLLGAAAGAGAGSDAPEVQHFATDDEKVGIDLPADWSVARGGVQQAVLALHARPPGVEGGVWIHVYNLHGIRGERGQTYRERREQPAVLQTKVLGDVHLDPVPHLVMDVPENGATLRHVWIFRVIDRDGFSLTFECDPAAWPSIKDSCFRAAASLTSGLGEWPARPDGYKAVVKDGFEYLLHPAVKEKDVDVLHATVLEQETRYEKLHGPVPKPPSNPIVIVVTPDKTAGEALSPGTAKSELGFTMNSLEGRLYAVPLKKGDPRATSELVDRIVALFQVQSVGDGTWDPVWLLDGERRAAAAESWTGKPLPTLSADFAKEMARDLVRFEDLARKPPRDATAQAFAYVAFFRAGPQAYRDPFAAFLKDLAATGDWESAQTTHLLSLDQTKLLAAAESFVAKDLKLVKGK